jgi:hypothetical protein
MTEEQINIAIAEACGWSCIKERTEEHVDLDSRTVTHITGISGYPKGWDSLNYLPDYVNDLNAMHEAEKSLKYDPENTWLTGGYSLYVQALPYGNEIRATSRQRAEAFLRALDKWKEVQP